MLKIISSSVDLENNVLNLNLNTNYEVIEIEIIDYSSTQTFDVNSSTNEVTLQISLNSIKSVINIKAEGRILIPFKFIDPKSFLIDYLTTELAEMKRTTELMRTFNPIKITENYPFEPNNYDNGFYDGLILGQMI